VRIHWTGLRWGTSCQLCVKSISPLLNGKHHLEVMAKYLVVFPMVDESNSKLWRLEAKCTPFTFIWRRMVLALQFVYLLIHYELFKGCLFVCGSPSVLKDIHIHSTRNYTYIHIYVVLSRFTTVCWQAEN